MPRARISSAGIELAAAGYDVDTAPLSKMIISPQFATMRLALSGSVTVGALAGIWGGEYDWANVTFPTVFPSPPMVFVSGQNSDGTADQTPFNYRADAAGGVFTWLPHYSVETYADHFELYVHKGGANIGSITRTWKYFVFANRGG